MIRYVSSVIFIILGLTVTIALALDPPHYTSHGISCGYSLSDVGCHKAHNALGYAITNASGNANLCMQCHSSTPAWVDASKYPFSNSDQATPGTGGTSHRWDANAINTTYQTSLPTSPDMYRRLDNGKLMCSTCHNQHSQSKASFDPASPAYGGYGTGEGRHYQRIDNNTNQMCLDCHTARNMTDVTTYTGSELSHPVGISLPSTTLFHNPPKDIGGSDQTGYSGTGDINAGGTSLTDSTKSWSNNSLVGLYVRFTTGSNKDQKKQITSNDATTINWSGALTVESSVEYEIDSDGNLTNNFRLDNSGTPSFTTGNVTCLSCHNIHYADSDSNTYDDKDYQP
jgi:predicted CXXCH cytochrome family protein